MKIFTFDRESGRTIDQYDSLNAVISRIAQSDGATTVHCLFLGPNGFLGEHPTEKPQVFIVVRGVGWVRAGSPERVRIIPGLAAFWEAGERHEAGSVTGMVAIVVEGEGLTPPIPGAGYASASPLPNGKGDN